MTHEDALYFEYLLALGFQAEFDAWLDAALEAENPLSDLTLELAAGGPDPSRTVSILHQYYMGQPVDEALVRDRLVRFLKKEYDAKRLDQKQVVYALDQLECYLDDTQDYDPAVWEDVRMLGIYLDAAIGGSVIDEDFDSLFSKYCDHGMLPGHGHLSGGPCSAPAAKYLWQKRSLLDWLKRFFGIK